MYCTCTAGGATAHTFTEDFDFILKTLVVVVDMHVLKIGASEADWHYTKGTSTMKHQSQFEIFI